MPLDSIPNILFQSSRRVYGVVLNDKQSIDAMGDALNDAPYNNSPKAPILYLKPSHTQTGSGIETELPDGEKSVEIGATLGLVMARSAAGLDVDSALESVAGIVLVADLSLPHSSYYRPAVREKSFDNSCVMSSLLPLSAFDNATIDIQKNGEVLERRSFTDLCRSPAQLLADVTEFMTLEAGDTLLLGVQWNAPQASVGDTVSLSLADAASIEFTIAGAQA